MKIKGITIMNPAFAAALEKLLTKEMPVSTCVALSEALQQIETHSSVVQKARTSLLDKYIDKDSDGNLSIDTMTDNKTKVEFKSPEAKVTFMKDITELGNQEFEVDFDKKILVSSEDKMTPQEYMMMKDFVEIKD